MQFSIRRRLLVLGGLCALTVALGVAGRLSGLIRGSLGEVLDDRLKAEAQWLQRGAAALGGASPQHPGTPPHVRDLAAFVAMQPHDSDTAYALRGADGVAWMAGPMPFAVPEVLADMSARAVALPESSMWRAAAVSVPTVEGAVTAVVFGRAVHADDVMQRMYALLGTLVLLMLVLSGAVVVHTSRVLRRALKVMEDSARNIAALRGGSRIPRVGAPRELGGLGNSLDVLADSFERTFATLGSERDRFEAVLEGLSDAVIALDAQQRITLANRSAMYLLGLEQPPIGRPLIEVTRVPILREVLDRLPSEPTVRVEIDWPGRRRRRLLVQAGTLRTSEGIVLVMTDLTALRRLETVRRDFVANVSHELRTPVGVILASAETLLDGALEDVEHARGFVEALHRNAERLARLISDLLDLSRIEAGQFEMKPINLNLHDAVEHVVDQLGSKAERKNITLENGVGAGVRAHVDPKALDQVLVNLMDNAIKYSMEGCRVRAWVAAEEGRVRISVEDNGPGLEPGHRERVFERFYRVDPGRSREMGGTGLGLSIVKHLVEHMGGEVGVETANPKGARFYFTVPEARMAPATGESGVGGAEGTQASRSNIQ